jgi:AraC-like DNA-binding protein/mannose-6-phosphate isomerase-like protein (cupin superfamily)
MKNSESVSYRPESGARSLARHIILDMRQNFEPTRGISISSLAHEYPAGWHVPAHFHSCGQLLYADSGVMQLTFGRTLLLVPPQFAVFIPARVVHSIKMPHAVSMRTLYLRHSLIADRARSVLYVRPLLRELILEAVRRKGLKRRVRAHAALCELLIAEIRNAEPVPIELAMPVDARARAFAEFILQNLSRPQALGGQCRNFGVSARTMQRLFRCELGTDVETWRRHARLIKAVELLSSGRRVKEIAAAVGYRQTATLTTAFRVAFGVPPKAWLAGFAQNLNVA